MNGEVLNSFMIVSISDEAFYLLISCTALQQAIAQDIGLIGSEQRKSLVDDLVLLIKQPQILIPTTYGDVFI
jgi:hypothetical protein